MVLGCALMKTRILVWALAMIGCCGLGNANANFFEEIRGSLVGPTVKGSPKYTALYFSAHWCPPCRLFTPKLVNWYKNFQPQHPDFELVFVSADHDASAMEKYIKEAGMPWPAVAYDKARSEIFMRHASEGIPYLVLIGPDGKALTALPGNEWQNPGAVLKKIESLVGGS